MPAAQRPAPPQSPPSRRARSRRRLRRLAAAAIAVAVTVLAVAELPRLYEHVFADDEPSEAPGATVADPALRTEWMRLREPAGPARGTVLVVTGDGGWSSLAEGVTLALRDRGYAAAVLDSILYFRERRTPEALAGELADLVRAMARRHPEADAVDLVGYSFGADVLPAAINRMPADAKAKLRTLVLISPSPSANFWLGTGLLVTWTGLMDEATAPEVARLAPLTIVCLYGRAVAAQSLCPLLGPPATALERPGGHHFDGDYPALGRVVADALDAGPAPADQREKLTALPASTLRKLPVDFKERSEAKK